MHRNKILSYLTVILFLLLCLLSETQSKGDELKPKETRDKLLFSKEDDSVAYANDDPQSSGEEEIFIPVPKKHDLPKSRPDPVTDEPTTVGGDLLDPDSNTELDVSVDPTSFKPVEFNFEHQYPVTTGEHSTVNPDGEEPDATTQNVKPQEGNELEEKRKQIQPLDTRPIKKNERVRLHSSLPDSQPDENKQEQPRTTDRTDIAGSYNDSNVILDQSTERTHHSGLSNIAKIGIAMGCVVALWLLLCPVVCIVCRNRDKKKQKRTEEQKMKNGVTTNNKQHPLMEELVLTEMGLGNGTNNHKANGKPYENDAKHSDELERLNKSDEPSNNCNDSLNKPSLGRAPLASTEALDTEV